MIRQLANITSEVAIELKQQDWSRDGPASRWSTVRRRDEQDDFQRDARQALQNWWDSPTL